MMVKQIFDSVGVRELEEKDALVFEGMVTTEENLSAILDWVKSQTTLSREIIYVIGGDVMNKTYGLTGTNAYPADIHIVGVCFEDIEDIVGLAVSRFKVGGRWLSDVVSNNARKEGGDCEEDCEED